MYSKFHLLVFAVEKCLIHLKRPLTLVYVYHLCKAYLIDSHHLQLLVQLAHLDFGLALVAKLVVPEV